MRLYIFSSSDSIITYLIVWICIRVLPVYFRHLLICIHQLQFANQSLHYYWHGLVRDLNNYVNQYSNWCVHFRDWLSVKYELSFYTLKSKYVSCKFVKFDLRQLGVWMFPPKLRKASETSSALVRDKVQRYVI